MTKTENELSELECVILHDVEDLGRKTGTDEQGNLWIEFEVDYFAQQLPGECSICNAELKTGWLCLDGGEEVCESHVIFKEDMTP